MEQAAVIDDCVALPFGRRVCVWDELTVTSTVSGDGDSWVAAKRAELEVFAIRNGWATPDDIAAGEVLEYLRFEDRSEIFVAAHSDTPDIPIGVARFIWGTGTLELDDQFLVTAAHTIDDEFRALLGIVGMANLAEWATLAAVGSSLKPMYALWCAAYRTSRARGIHHWLQSIVEPLFDGYRSAFKMPIIRIGEPEIVVGARSLPTLVFLEDAATGRMLEDRMELKRRLFGPWVDRTTYGHDDGLVA